MLKKALESRESCLTKRVEDHLRARRRRCAREPGRGVDSPKLVGQRRHAGIVSGLAGFPQPGDEAPDFDLAGTDGKFRLSAHRGAPVVLLFYPRDESTVCTKQFCFYRDRYAELTELGVLAVGISPQDIASHERFIAGHGLRLPLLSDVDLEVAKAYSVNSRLLGTKRATFVIDAAGIVRYRHEHVLSLTFDTVEDLRRALISAS